MLRPSIVIGLAAYGGSALLRGLAALPLLPVLPDTRPVQPVHLDDVVESVLRFLCPQAPVRVAMDVVGPRRMSFSEAVQMMRRWLRWQRASPVAIPPFAASVILPTRDIANALGWRTPINTTAQAEMTRGAMGDPTAWQNALGRQPTDVETALLREPASVQERWFAAVIRIETAHRRFRILLDRNWPDLSRAGLRAGHELPPRGQTSRMLGSNNAGGRSAGGCHRLRDPLPAAQPLWTLGAFIISLVYVVIGTILVPRLWSAPLGPMLKSGRTRIEPRGARNPRGSLMLYFFVKFLHVIGAAVLLGTGAGIAFFMLVAHLRGDAREIASVARTVVIADFLFTAAAVVIQPVTGVWFAWSTGYSLLQGWIALRSSCMS